MRSHIAGIMATLAVVSGLHWVAATTDDSEMAELLIRSGSEVNGPDENGMTPLHIAVEERHASVVRVLLENGADSTVQATRGWCKGKGPADLATASKDASIRALFAAQQ